MTDIAFNQQLFRKWIKEYGMVEMIKNGLFLCSIGSLIVLYSLNPHSQRYDLYSMVTGLFLTGLGIYFFMKGKKEKKQRRKITNGNHEKMLFYLLLFQILSEKL
ncbi:hypothetical protein EfmAA242_09020 [Enterococcus faecium]|nr:hypothetical protein EfmAA242_09020 [Enterococcus faecium]